MSANVVKQVNYCGIYKRGDEYFSNTKVLCNHCGANSVCGDYAAKQCRSYIPIIKFTPPIRGLVGEFNTFRIGKAWGNRLSDGTVVCLADSKKSEIVGYARITKIYIGDKYKMARMYARDNHTMRALEVKRHIAETMLKRLKSTSGTRLFECSDLVTVIYMVIIDEIEVESGERGKKRK